MAFLSETYADNQLINAYVGVAYNDYHENWHNLFHVIDLLEKQNGFLYTFTIDPSGCEVVDTLSGFKYNAQSITRIMAVWLCVAEAVKHFHKNNV